MKEYPPEFFSRLGGCFLSIVAFTLLTLVAIVLLVSKCVRRLETPSQDEQSIVAKGAADSSIDLSMARISAWADSISAFTGIAYGPYFYDPSWPIEYSTAGDTLYYFPRDSVTTHFTIPETVRFIDSRAFQCNKHLAKITLPPGVHEIGVCSFYGCAVLREVIIEGSVVSIPWRAFDGCHKLQTVDLPASVNSIGGYSFSGCESLRTVIVRNPQPPHFEFEDDPEDFETMGAFFGTDLSRSTLHVPKGSVDSYRQAPGWTMFKWIIGF